ncbi:MAG: UDP-N-acetylmuramyl-tripeptide synthetase [Parcubacteria group bacterium GW2011_GWB1_57_6]|nr:MAG: UDP-N-acetylmuramyl-tripeptide synthetase [Parcubacteria group bacterium GW2011_GWB1_57_6]
MCEFVNKAVRTLKNILPEQVVRPFLPLYHALLSFLMALSYGFPGRKLVVVGITGTKGKSTTAEMVFSVLRAAGYKTALISTIRFAIEDDSEPNRYKMTLQGRGFAQAFMRKALDAGCTHLVIEITSESVMQYRHWFLYLDGLIVTNIQREHIESHGSFEKYIEAKRAVVSALVHSPKNPRILVANSDIPESRFLLSVPVTRAMGFTSRKLKISEDERSVHFEYKGMQFALPLPGAFNAMNALGALKLSEALGIPLATIAIALASLEVVHGRMEHIDAGQDFLVIVDYAHTPDSLRALYGAFPERRKICVLGNTGGGRDAWKRPEMGRIADESCKKIILTNEDPYDEDPRAIIDAMARGMKRAPKIIMDRRAAIRAALRAARKGDAVLISGKGTDPFIMGAHGAKLPWNDAEVVREELKRLLAERRHS